MNRDISVGIDIGAQRIQTMVARHSADGTKQIIGYGEAPSAGMRKGNIIDTARVSQQLNRSLAQAAETSGMRITNALFSYNGSSLESFVSRGSILLPHTYSEITDRDVERVIEASYTSALPLVNKSIIHRFPLVFRVDKDIVTQDPRGLSGSRLEVETLFVSMFTKHLDQIVQTAEQSDIVVDDVVAAPVAASRSTLSQRQKEVGVMTLDIGAHTTGVAVFEEGSPIMLARFPGGSEAITHDIAIGLRIDLEEAERYKKTFGQRSARKKELETIVESRINDIFDEVNRHLKKTGRDRLLPAGVVLTGGGAKLFGIERTAKEALQLPAEIASSCVLKEFDAEFDPSWAVVMGLCLLAHDNQKEGPGIVSSMFGNTGAVLWRWVRSFVP